jgi:hypothetical protein
MIEPCWSEPRALIGLRRAVFRTFMIAETGGFRVQAHGNRRARRSPGRDRDSDRVQRWR